MPKKGSVLKKKGSKFYKKGNVRSNKSNKYEIGELERCVKTLKWVKKCDRTLKQVEELEWCLGAGEIFDELKEEEETSYDLAKLLSGDFDDALYRKMCCEEVDPEMYCEEVDLNIYVAIEFQDHILNLLDQEMINECLKALVEVDNDKRVEEILRWSSDPETCDLLRQEVSEEDLQM